jgi:hypothetical protein
MSHNKKINQFIAAAGQHGNFKHSVRQVSIILESLSRNNFLYPTEILPGQFIAPKDRLVDADAQDLIRRVTGIKTRIDQIV